MASKNVYQLAQILFRFKKQYKDLTDKEKEDNFFIINRYLSKGYPIQANFLNKKGIDKASAFDIWFNHLSKTYNIPDWMFKKEKKVEKNKFSKDEREILIKFYKIDPRDIDFLSEYYYNDMIEELNKFSIFK